MSENTAFVRMEAYEKVRASFTDEEREILNSEICGETICPRGVIVTLTDQTVPLIQRIKGAP